MDKPMSSYLTPFPKEVHQDAFHRVPDVLGQLLLRPPEIPLKQAEEYPLVILQRSEDPPGIEAISELEQPVLAAYGGQYLDQP